MNIKEVGTKKKARYKTLEPKHEKFYGLHTAAPLKSHNVLIMLIPQSSFGKMSLLFKITKHNTTRVSVFQNTVALKVSIFWNFFTTSKVSIFWNLFTTSKVSFFWNFFMTSKVSFFWDFFMTSKVSIF